MKVKNITSIDKCKATDIVDYFADIIGDDLESIIYKLYNQRLKNEDKEYIDNFVNMLNLSNPEEIKRIRKKMIYTLLQQSSQNEDRNIKLKILYEIYVRYNEQLLKPAHAKKMKMLKDLMLEERDAVVLSHDGDILKYDIITRDEQKSIDDITNKDSKELLGVGIDVLVGVEDFEQIVKIPNLASSIVRKCLIDFMYELGKDRQDVKDVTQTDIFKDNNKILNSVELRTLCGSETISKSFEEYLIDYLKQNIQLIDTDTLYRNAAARLILGIRLNNGEIIDEIELQEEMEQEEMQSATRNSIRYLEKFYKELARRPSDKRMAYQISGQGGKEIITVDLEYIKNFLQRCTKYKYFSDADILAIHSQIKQGILPEDMQVRKIANIDINDLVNASRSYEEIEDDPDMKTRLKSCSLDIVKYLKEIGTISSDEQLLELYLSGDLHLDIIQEVEIAELVEQNYIDAFQKMHKEVNSEENGVQKKRFVRYSELYKKLIEKEQLDKDELIEKLFEQYGEDSENKMLIDLYNSGIINLEECISWGGTAILQTIFEMENRNIQPSQINSMYYKKLLSLNEIANLILRIPNREERYITIASIFPEVAESEERQELVYKTIDVDNTVSKKDKTDIEGKQVGTTGGNNEYKKHITDSIYRFNLIRLLDAEYFMEMTADGHAIIKLPNFKKVMIEKMLDTKKEEGYGAASYILDENYYVDNEAAIKINGKIDRRELSKALKAERATRIFHVVHKWGEQIKQYFEDVSQSKYTEEEEKAINAAIENIKNSVKIK